MEEGFLEFAENVTTSRGIAKFCNFEKISYYTLNTLLISNLILQKQGRPPISKKADLGGLYLNSRIAKIN